MTGEWRKLRNEKLMMCTPQPIFSSDKIEKNGMGWACSAYEGEGRRIQSFGGET